jgi:hypothetical protein
MRSFLKVHRLPLRDQQTSISVGPLDRVRPVLWSPASRLCGCISLSGSFGKSSSDEQSISHACPSSRYDHVSNRVDAGSAVRAGAWHQRPGAFTGDFGSRAESHISGGRGGRGSLISYEERKGHDTCALPEVRKRQPGVCRFGSRPLARPVCGLQFCVHRGRRRAGLTF